jgi:adenylosuccinate synthase
MHRVVVLSGHSRVGKTSLSAMLEKRFQFFWVKTSTIVRQYAIRHGRKHDRIGLQEIGDEFDENFGHDWLFRYVQEVIQVLDGNGHSDRDIVVDSVRTWEQLAPFRSCSSIELVHIHLYATGDQIIARAKDKYGDDTLIEQNDIIKREKDIKRFRDDADIRLNTDNTDTSDTIVRVLAGLRLLSPPERRLVDVLVGGQFGSEGKGHVAAYIAGEYDVLVRVGGPNAGHTVSGTDGLYTYHHLPSGTKGTDAEIIIGPGATLYVPSLLKEIAECGITQDRLFIDPQAMIISDEDRKNEARLRDDISSTSSGSGLAAARRIADRGKSSTLLARDISELRPYVGQAPDYRGSTLARLELAFSQGKSVLLEGTQGSGLSIFHGPYPYVTSRDTNVAGCLAEAGISPSRVRRILMVVRSTPIRVANPPPPKIKGFLRRTLMKAGLPKPGRKGPLTSGPLKHETDFAQIANRSGLEHEVLKQNEITSTTKRDRRVGWFEWDSYRNACAINAPTDIVLTFADYISEENVNARRFEQLSDQTRHFIEELERVSCAPVSLIATRFPRTEQERLDRRSIIDRRDWQTSRAKQQFGAIDPFSTSDHIESEFESLRARVNRIRSFLDATEKRRARKKV